MALLPVVSSDRKINADRVRQVMARLIEEHGAPELSQRMRRSSQLLGKKHHTAKARVTNRNSQKLIER